MFFAWYIDNLMLSKIAIPPPLPVRGKNIVVLCGLGIVCLNETIVKNVIYYFGREV